MLTKDMFDLTQAIMTMAKHGYLVLVAGTSVNVLFQAPSQLIATYQTAGDFIRNYETDFADMLEKENK